MSVVHETVVENAIKGTKIQQKQDQAVFSTSSVFKNLIQLQGQKVLILWKKIIL